jgi:hypothetical protein
MAASCALRSGANGPLEVITGAQIRQARELLGWPPTRLARRAKVHSAIVRRAESVEGGPPLTVYQAALVCRERSIVRGDGGRFTTAPPSRLEARSRLGDKAANELGAPAVSSIPAQLPGPEPASARKGREDDRAVLRWN